CSTAQSSSGVDARRNMMMMDVDASSLGRRFVDELREQIASRGGRERSARSKRFQNVAALHLASRKFLIFHEASLPAQCRYPNVSGVECPVLGATSNPLTEDITWNKALARLSADRCPRRSFWRSAVEMRARVSGLSYIWS